VRKLDHIREIESLVLRIADPRGNRAGGRLKNAIDLRRELRRSMEERSRLEIESIVPRAWRRDKKRIHLEQARRATRSKSRQSTSKERPLKKLFAGKQIVAAHKGEKYSARVNRYGVIRLKGVIYETPTAAAVSITGKPTNGWNFWKVRNNGELVRLRKLRK